MNHSDIQKCVCWNAAEDLCQKEKIVDGREIKHSHSHIMFLFCFFGIPVSPFLAANLEKLQSLLDVSSISNLCKDIILMLSNVCRLIADVWDQRLSGVLLKYQAFNSNSVSLKDRNRKFDTYKFFRLFVFHWDFHTGVLIFNSIFNIMLYWIYVCGMWLTEYVKGFFFQ